MSDGFWIREKQKVRLMKNKQNNKPRGCHARATSPPMNGAADQLRPMLEVVRPAFCVSHSDSVCVCSWIEVMLVCALGQLI